MKIKVPKQDNILRVAYKQKYPGICLYIELKMRTLYIADREEDS
jgi:hypothetical protein